MPWYFADECNPTFEQIVWYQASPLDRFAVRSPRGLSP
jgi:hypothetical protein